MKLSSRIIHSQALFAFRNRQVSHLRFRALRCFLCWLAAFLMFTNDTPAAEERLGEPQSTPSGGYSVRFPEGWIVTKDDEVLKAESGEGANHRQVCLYRQSSMGNYTTTWEEQEKFYLAVRGEKGITCIKVGETEIFKTKEGAEAHVIHTERVDTKDRTLKCRNTVFIFRGKVRNGSFRGLEWCFSPEADIKAAQPLMEAVIETFRFSE